MESQDSQSLLNADSNAACSISLAFCVLWFKVACKQRGMENRSSYLHQCALTDRGEMQDNHGPRQGFHGVAEGRLKGKSSSPTCVVIRALHCHLREPGSSFLFPHMGEAQLALGIPMGEREEHLVQLHLWLAYQQC